MKGVTTKHGTLRLLLTLMVSMVAVVSFTFVFLYTTKWKTVQTQFIEGNSLNSGIATKSITVKDSICERRFVRYVSSDFEQMWLDNIAEWQKVDQYCNVTIAMSEDFDLYLESVKRLMTVDPNLDNVPHSLRDEYKRILSRFDWIVDCESSSFEYSTYIEPLAGALRHPKALCYGGKWLVDRSYLLVDYLTPQQLHCFERRMSPKCQFIYVDLGASLFNKGAGGASQQWFIEAYKNTGMPPMDRILLWEATTMDPNKIFGIVPPPVLPAYQYFNIPAVADTNDPKNPLNIVKEIAGYTDFVTFKLDIDSPMPENLLSDYLLNDDSFTGIIDEFFYEQHVAFPPMLRYWKSCHDPNRTLEDSYHFFLQLRRKEIRAHGWP